MAPPPKLKQSSMESFLKQPPNPKPTPQTPTTSSSPSDYERVRQETIRRNRDFLQKLGIITTPTPTPSTPNPLPTKRNPKPLPPSSLPLRRSTRKRGPPPPSSDDADDIDADDNKPPQSSDLEFADSSVFQYACNSTILSSTVSKISSHPILGFEVVGKAFRDPSLAKIYSIDVCFLKDRRFLIAAGGHGGFISVYGGRGEGEGMIGEEEGPLMSWKGSRSWISRVMFVVDNPMLLVSSSNDGRVVVWDIKKEPAVMSSSSCSPPVVAEAVGFHSSGIFSMDQLSCSIATASKDSSVGISKLTTAGELITERNITGHHSGAIRGVRFGDEKDRLADCGADGLICVLDTRLPLPCALTIESQHSTGVNTIEWCNTNKFLLLSASKDPTLLIYDIRSSAEPFHRLEGHVESNSRSCYNIYRPSFVDGGKVVATPGQGSRKISLYSVDKGTLISQGKIGYDANLVMFTSDDAEHPRLWAAGKQINQLHPLSHPPF